MKSFIIFILIQTILFGKMEKKKKIFHCKTALDFLSIQKRSTVNQICSQLSSLLVLFLYFHPLPVMLCSCYASPPSHLDGEIQEKSEK